VATDRAAPKTYLVLGGSGSGKSEFAQKLAARCGQPVTYLATGKAEGSEMAWRIRKHQASRPASWRTVEAPRGLAQALARAAGGAPVVLLEDVGSLAAACLPWIAEDGGEMTFPQAAIETARQELDAELDAVFAWCAAAGKHLVVVSSEVGLGFLPESPAGRLYKDVLGDANQALAARVERAFLVIAGLAVDLTARSAQVHAAFGLEPA
jgi:adenosylcobinamide kinase/adenosylcobinamide-phosphate guanylyltransferase